MKLWIARNTDNRLSLHLTTPEYNEIACDWISGALLTRNIDISDFPEVTFENSPQEVELVIKK